jgi:hypothetical protein
MPLPELLVLVLVLLVLVLLVLVVVVVPPVPEDVLLVPDDEPPLPLADSSS